MLEIKNKETTELLKSKNRLVALQEKFDELEKDFKSLQCEHEQESYNFKMNRDVNRLEISKSFLSFYVIIFADLCELKTIEKITKSKNYYLKLINLKNVNIFINNALMNLKPRIMPVDMQMLHFLKVALIIVLLNLKRIPLKLIQILKKINDEVFSQLIKKQVEKQW